MEAIATHTACADGARQRKRRLLPGHRCVKRRVKACNLRQIGPQACKCFDGSKIARLMQGRQRAQRMQRREHRGIDAYRCRELFGTMHNAVSGRHDVRSHTPFVKQIEYSLQGTRLPPGATAQRQHLPIGRRDRQLRRISMQIDMATQFTLRFRSIDGKQRKFKAR